jgi:hypothetical protein
MVAQWEDAGDEDGDALRQSSGWKINVEDEVKASMVMRAPGLPHPRTRGGRRHALMLPIPDVEGI